MPRPIEGTDDAILMAYVGDRDVSAPRLHEYQHDDRDELASLWDQLHGAIEQMLYRDVVHGDLSSYNVLVWDGRITLIDFPQAVDPKKNRHAHHLRVFMVQLRKKLEVDPGRPRHLRTEPGVGYRFQTES